MRIDKAEFVQSCTATGKCPADGKPEFAFIGRSNVGKSSLINMLTNHRGLAKTSSTPGKTQTLNHFDIDRRWYLVDMPGYGYARVGKSLAQEWRDFSRQYILTREAMACLFVLVDSRHEPQRIDLEFIDWLGQSGVPFALVFTKADKLSGLRLRANLEAYKAKLSETWDELPPMFATSAESRQGKEELLDYIGTILESMGR